LIDIDSYRNGRRKKEKEQLTAFLGRNSPLSAFPDSRDGITSRNAVQMTNPLLPSQ